MIGEKDMGAAEKIKMVAKDKKITYGNLGELIGMKPKMFYKKLDRNSMSYTDAEKIADALNCDIIFKDRKTGKEY